MKTFEEQQAFFESRWPEMAEAARAGGAPAVLAFVDGHADDLQRRVLHLFARQGLVQREWEGRSLDVAAEVAQGSIGRLLDESRQAAEAGDEETARRRKELANVISYNLAADLADCWPGERPALERRHFEAGQAAAVDCVRWREELAKGPGPSAMAWWAKGMHELSLGRTQDAVASFERSLAFAREDADDERAFGTVLGRGYLGLARWIAGDDAGRALYREALGDFANQLTDPERQEDARFGIDQLETVKQRYGPSGSA